MIKVQIQGSCKTNIVIKVQTQGSCNSNLTSKAGVLQYSADPRVVGWLNYASTYRQTVLRYGLKKDYAMLQKDRFCYFLEN